MFPSIRRIFYDNPGYLYDENGFRHEIKYTLTPDEYIKLSDFCAGFMSCDENADADGGYSVKSYYFDTLYYTDYMEKDSGVYERKKYRIRTYGDTGHYRLEKKIKRGSLNNKLSGGISPGDADMLITGGFGVVTGDEITDSIISEMYMNGYRNSIYIEYTRQPFVIEDIGLRITFDRDIGFVYGNYGLDELMPEPTPVYYNGETIMEIKYKDVLPAWLKRAIFRIAPSEFSTSKYTESLRYFLG